MSMLIVRDMKIASNTRLVQDRLRLLNEGESSI